SWEVGAEALTGAEVRERLRRELPEYMVPWAVVGLDAMPLSPNGKVDRKALPAPEGDSQVREVTPYVEPRTDVERAVAEVWRELLGVEQVGVNDNFFDLGGHSLLAVQSLSRLRDRMRVEVPVKLFFEVPTVDGVAKAASAMNWAARALDASAAAAEGAPGAELEEGVL
ncbi:MAG TPA: phosphopantetheine-binding protein, partial [Pyrinomonadaceae bacterium]|nr:phosphopantetheine-binding protein [Pyrinomonadaceae bacterium]